MRRWELDSEDGLSEGYGINESPHGEFVLYSDVAPLVEALRKIEGWAGKGRHEEDFEAIESAARNALKED